MRVWLQTAGTGTKPVRDGVILHFKQIIYYTWIFILDIVACYALWSMLGPDRNFGTGFGEIWAGTGRIGWYQTGTAIVISERVFKGAKRTVENKYNLKSENVEMLFFMKYNLRFLNFRSNWEIRGIVLAGVRTRDLRIVGRAYYHYTT